MPKNKKSPSYYRCRQRRDNIKRQEWGHLPWEWWNAPSPSQVYQPWLWWNASSPPQIPTQPSSPPMPQQPSPPHPPPHDEISDDDESSDDDDIDFVVERVERVETVEDQQDPMGDSDMEGWAEAEFAKCEAMIAEYDKLIEK